MQRGKKDAGRALVETRVPGPENQLFRPEREEERPLERLDEPDEPLDRAPDEPDEPLERLTPDERGGGLELRPTLDPVERRVGVEDRVPDVGVRELVLRP